MPGQRHESEDVDIAPLAQPLHFEFSGQTAKNRIMKAPMAERMSSWDPKDINARGIPPEGLVKVYQRWGEGGYGMIITGNIMLDPNHLVAPGDAVIASDAPFSGARFEAFRRLGAAGKANGSLMLAQVSHPGRQTPSRLQPDPISASDTQLQGTVVGSTYAKPHAASQEEIDHIVEAFAHAAEYLYKAGFDGIQLHGAHGFLLAQFLSESTNQRTDKYGGSLENRSRIILEIAQAIRKRRVPNSFILGIKLNSVEFQARGFDAEECRDLCRSLEAHRFDFVELSGGTYEALGFEHKRDSTRKREAFFLDFAEVIAPALRRTKTYVTGGLKTVGAMVKALDTVDGIGLGRPGCAEFLLARDILAAKVQGIIKPLIDEDDYGMALMASGAQILRVGKDHDPMDLSDEQTLQNFMKAMAAWMQASAEDGEMRMYGYVDVPA
ncbi:MAG: hypothetical protein M1816_007771 [Peltula sp. TS41687]|nr:MAG: hypothetical protein M1816_007771 [Peltula sp. TS41687]